MSQPNGNANGFGNGRHQGRNRTRGGPALWVWVVGGVLLLAAGTAAAFYVIRTQSTGTAGAGLTFEVAQGPIVVSVTESGTIKAAEQEIIKSEIEGQATLIYLIPEGTRVQKGDLLAELDVTGMNDERIEDEIAVQTSEAAAVSAGETLEVTRNQAKADVAQARLDYQFAQEDLTKYREGEYPKLLVEANNKIEIAEEEFTRAKDKWEGSTKLFEGKYISETELLADQLAMNKARLNLDLSRRELDLLEKWTYARQIAQLESDVEQKKFALERAERKASADVVQAEADLKAKQSELERRRGRLQRTMEQLAKGKIYASREGLVVYATSAQGGGWRGNQEPLQEGQSVRERQDLIYLPTATQMIAEIKVHESSLEKVRLGMPVRITVDALPGKSYRGEVTKIAPLPDATSQWMNPDLKVYNTEIRLTGNGSELRTGMSCRAEIIVQTYDNATYVPVQSVVRVSGTPTAFVLRDEGSLEQRKVEIGQDNNRMVVIESGLKPGERVLLAPPLGDTATIETIRPEELSNEEKQKAEEAQDNPRVVPQQGGPGGMENMPSGPGGNGSGGPPQGQVNGGGQGGMPDQAAMQRMRQAWEQLNAKMTEEEKARLAELREKGDMQVMMQYGQDMSRKYGVELPSMGTGQRGGRSGGGEGRDPERGGNRGNGGNGGGGRPETQDNGGDSPRGETQQQEASK